MKIFMGRQFLKEGIVNLVRHPLVTLASVTTIALMLVLMGAFLIFSENANKMATSISQQPPILIWVEYGAHEDTVSNIDNVLLMNDQIKTYTMQTPLENFEMFKEELGENSSVLEGFDPNLLPYTFTVQLVDSSESENFKIYMEGIFGVRKVEYSQPVTEFLNNIRKTVNLITLTAFMVLFGITLFIISNMVRIAVYSRSEEIGIMKYVGATTMYIRIPFIIEGSVVGFLGSIIASGIVLIAYSLILEKFGLSAGASGLFNLVGLSEIMNKTVFLNLLTGVLIGAMGSSFSVRRHVKV